MLTPEVSPDKDEVECCVGGDDGTVSKPPPKPPQPPQPPKPPVLPPKPTPTTP